jgi:hypothetical protein
MLIKAKYAKQKKEAAITGLRDGMKGCVEEKEIAEESAGKTIDNVKRAKFAKECDTAVKEKFEAAGGDDKQFKEARAQAARKQLQERGKTCMGEYLSENSITTATADDYKAARKDCASSKKEDFIKGGGDPVVFMLEEDRATEEAMDNVLEAAIENHADVKAATTAAQRKTAFKTAYAAKKDEIQKAFEANGGDKDDFERKQMEMQRKATGKYLRACMETEIANLKLSGDPTDTQMKDAFATYKPNC